MVRFCDAFDFSLSKIWEKVLMIWLRNYYLKALEIITFKFQICRTNIYWDNRCFMFYGFYRLWCEPHLVITIPVLLILQIVGKTNSLYIVKCLWLSIYYKCIFIRVCFQQQSNQSSATECLAFLCTVHVNRVISE